MSTNFSIWPCNIGKLIINVNIFNGKAAKKEEGEKKKMKEKERKRKEKEKEKEKKRTEKERKRKKSGCFPRGGKTKVTSLSIFK
jgi:hypothetical protein